MKYNDSNKPLQCFMTQSTCYKGTGKMAVKGVLWHSTGANNPTLKRYVQPDDNAANRDSLLALIGKNSYNNDWNHIVRQAGLNCWIGKLADGTVTTIQTMPWDYKPWGCGSGAKGSCNNGWIQFEICEDGLTDSAYFKKVYDEACEITAYLCKMFGIDPNGTVNVNGVTVPTILCHADSCKLGLGSNHGDVNHWFPKHGKSMATARADVAALLGTVDKPSAVVTPTQPTPTTTTIADAPKAIWDFLTGKGLNACAVAGLMGNLYAESALSPTNLQNTYEKKLGLSDSAYTQAVDNGSYTNFVKDSAGYGLAQWTYWSRKQGLLEYAQKVKKSIGDLSMQLEFLWQELQGYTSVMKTLKAATSVQVASDAVLTGYERPANQGDAVKTKRAEYGKKYYDKYAASVPVTTPVVTAPTTPVATFTPRKSAPTATSKYWKHTSAGGLNDCILIANVSTLPNCVGYAWGRFYEIIGSRPKLSRRNAEDWFGYTADGYKRGNTPKLGAVICWRKGQVGNQSDGAGHVAIVEEIKANGDIVTSNSGYNSTRFWTQTFTKASGYSLGSAYTFQGFIYPPIDFGNSTAQVETVASYLARVTASALNIRKQPTTASAVTGTIKDKGVYTIVEEASGTGATRWGKLKSGAGWISLDYTKKV